jgi:endonuclease YncB( thermonuclease family)
MASASRGDSLAGQASVIDGYTLEMHGQRIRLWGIDAPESNQLCRGDDSCDTDAARRQRTTLTPSLRDGRSIARLSA